MSEINPYAISKLQREIMFFIDDWITDNNVPIARKTIIRTMTDDGVKEPTVILAVNTLVRKGYLRRTRGNSNKTYYIQLRRI